MKGLNRTLAAGGLFAVCCGMLACEGAAATTVRYVDEFDLSSAVSGYGYRTRAKLNCAGGPLKVRGKTSSRGFGDHPESALAFRTNGKVLWFDALIGLDEASDAAAKGSYGRPQGAFRVWADGKLVWTSGFLNPGDGPNRVHVDLRGAEEIVLESTSGEVWTACNAVFADWLDARFTLDEGAELEVVKDPARTAQLGILTPKEKDEPQFNGADIWGVRPGHEVIFRVPVTGVRPMTFAAKGLPDGVTLDEKGVLRGTAPAKKGDYDIEVTARNAKGEAKRTIRLAVGDTIALTPPMGWNSWNMWGWRLTQKLAMDSARALDESGLGDHGWAYVNLDDYWEMNNDPERSKRRPQLRGPARDKDGRILPNPDFPDMRGFTDYVHSLGFKAGLYSSPGPVTCGRCEGSYDHELQDATSWAEWGFDYVKYDWCSYGQVFMREAGVSNWYAACVDPQYREHFIRPYRLMNECLRKQPRDIVYSFCQYGMQGAEGWARQTGANCWRSWRDLKDSWIWLEQAIESNIHGEYWKWCGAGCWGDPDMLVVGQQGSFGSDHPSYLTPNEQYTHISIWAMVGSPLLIGCDLTKLDAFTRNLLANDRVIAISQDRLGQVARRIRHTDAESVWVRTLAGGDLAVALVNRYPLSRNLSVPFAEIGLDGMHWVRDCWTGKCEGRHGGAYSAEVPPHATKLVRIKADGCPKCDEKEAAADEALAKLVAEDVAKPVRPVGVNGQTEYWNVNATWFMYPPEFAFPAAPKADGYVVRIIDSNNKVWWSSQTNSVVSLERLWMELPDGRTDVWCDAYRKHYHWTVARNFRSFWKMSPYRPGTYPKAPRSYAEAAEKCCLYLLKTPWLAKYAETGKPDPDYKLNCYPTKMDASVIGLMSSFARVSPAHREPALKLARAAADHLISISQPKDAPLAYFPPTYVGENYTSKDYVGMNMLDYPASAAGAYLKLSEVTGEGKYLEAAKNIAETYLRLQGEDGTWYLKMYEKDGRPVSENRLHPLGVASMMSELFKRTGDERYRRSSDRALRFYEEGPLRDWNWEGQFEDVEPTGKYENLTKHPACSLAQVLVADGAKDGKRVAQARELLRFAEDQFVVWQRPKGDDAGSMLALFGHGWDVEPAVVEQYYYREAVDASAAKLINTYLALYKATGNPLDLAKARTLGDAIVRIQKPDGRIQTIWSTETGKDLQSDWVNCMALSIGALVNLAACDEK